MSSSNKELVTRYENNKCPGGDGFTPEVIKYVCGHFVLPQIMSLKGGIVFTQTVKI